jgi:hypothetical protein
MVDIKSINDDNNYSFQPDKEYTYQFYSSPIYRGYSMGGLLNLHHTCVITQKNSKLHISFGFYPYDGRINSVNFKQGSIWSPDPLYEKAKVDGKITAISSPKILNNNQKKILNDIFNDKYCQKIEQKKKKRSRWQCDVNNHFYHIYFKNCRKWLKTFNELVDEEKIKKSLKLGEKRKKKKTISTKIK